MKAPDLIIQGGSVFLDSGPIDADVCIREERIDAIVAPKSGVVARKVINARGLCVFPGIVDLHVHFREPGLTHKEDFGTGSRAALAGGVTTVFDMPNVQPATTTPLAFREKLLTVASKAHCDFGLWAGGTDGSSYAAFATLGAVGVKIYQQQLAKIRGNAYFRELFCTEEDALLRVFQSAAQARLPVCLHAGAPPMERIAQERLQRDGRCRMEDLDGLRRIPAASLGTAKCIHLAELTGARLHIAHISLSGPECLELVRRAKQRGVSVTAECPPVALTLKDLKRFGPYGLPFSLPKKEILLYWKALEDGTIDAVGTDHAPHTKKEKLRGSDNVWKAPTGYPALEVSLAIGLEQVRKGTISLNRLIESMSSTPARIAGLYPRKGSIRVGSDADLTLVDLESSWTVRAEKMESKAGWSPFEGKKFKGRAVGVVLRGMEAMRDGEILARAGDGKYLGLKTQGMR